MQRLDSLHELKTLILSYHPAIAAETAEEPRLQSLLKTAAAELELPLFTWSIADGLARTPSKHALLASTNAPLLALRHIEDLTVDGIFLLYDFAHYLEDPAVSRQFRNVLHKFTRSRSCFVLAGPRIKLPPEINQSVVHFDLPLPGKEEIDGVFTAALESLRRDHRFSIEVNDERKAPLLDALSGLTLNQARQRIVSAILEDGRLDASDITRIHEEKARLIRDSGLLEYFPAADNHHELGGFDNLKAWLERAAIGFSEEAKAVNLSPPKGILLVGVQGCGKSLAAKAIARQWSLPLLKLDAGSLYNKFIGESENNFRKALKLAESLAPTVLWIDELEKAFATGSAQGSEADGGTSMRIFGSFLTWLQEKKDGVFVVGTANNLQALPPELLRKGRFDEVFFVDLPDTAEREIIVRIHLSLRKQDTAQFDLPGLAAASDGFSGAEIEQVVVSGLYTALHLKQPLTTDLILREIAATVPLSISRREEIRQLREYARDRFVPVRSPEAPPFPPQLPVAKAV